MIPLLAAAALMAQPMTPPDLRWLAGDWREVLDGVVYEERWSCARDDGVAEGEGRTLKDGAVTASESMRIGPGPDGRLTFTARPSGQPGASFRVVEATPGRLRFSNPQHDFPKAVTYARDGEALTAAISAAPDGEPPTQTWRFQRVAPVSCD